MSTNLQSGSMNLLHRITEFSKSTGLLSVCVYVLLLHMLFLVVDISDMEFLKVLTAQQAMTKKASRKQQK